MNKKTDLLQELSKHLLNLSARCLDQSYECEGTQESAWLLGSSRGYQMAAQILSCRASLLLQETYEEEHHYAGLARLSDMYDDEQSRGEVA